VAPQFEVIIMGQYLLLLKPNLSLPYSGSSVFTGTITAASGSSITLNADPGAIKAGNSNTTCHWIKVTNGTYDTYHWRIMTESGANITVDVDKSGVPSGLATSNSGGAPSYAIYSSVPSQVAWTDPSTITYHELRPSKPLKSLKSNDIKIRRYTNQGWVIVNLKKQKHTYALKDVFLGSAISETSAEQVVKGLDYSLLLWPNTSPKYSNMYWYDNRGFRSDMRDKWDTGTTAYRMARAVMTEYGEVEDVQNNYMIDTIALEVN
jgi:hypothetical protein